MLSDISVNGIDRDGDMADAKLKNLIHMPVERKSVCTEAETDIRHIVLHSGKGIKRLLRIRQRVTRPGYADYGQLHQL
ncbi:hypothetical protein D3C80_2154000 [compost metagenome]